ncbi:MAG: CPBP family intramembrane metalloprotease [Planctomycetes bacterium]|nr:CPBP family intramembrane metalloprotease [Planctomycetota bacterium]
MPTTNPPTAPSASASRSGPPLGGESPRSQAGRRRAAALALLLLIPLPSLGIASEMIWFQGTLGLLILGATKVGILALPWLWSVFVDRTPPALARPSRAALGLGLGLSTGLVGAAAVVLGYWFLLRDRIDPSTVREMARANHMLEPRVFLAVAVYICLLNSLLEEYVWRWFVYRQFEVLAPRPLAVVLAALGFTLHHSLILATQFGAELCWIGSLAVFTAGVAWSWLFARTRSVWCGWISHALVDVAVFWAAWRILFG